MNLIMHITRARASTIVLSILFVALIMYRMDMLPINVAAMAVLIILIAIAIICWYSDSKNEPT